VTRALADGDDINTLIDQLAGMRVARNAWNVNTN